MSSEGWMRNLVYGYIRTNTVDHVFVSQLIHLFLAYFIVYIEIPINHLFENGIKLSVPQLQEDAKLIKNEYQVPEIEEDSSDDEIIKQAKYVGDWDEMQKWVDKCMFFGNFINIYINIPILFMF